MGRHHDPERIERACRAMRGAGVDALACAMPANVLMLTGYWPVVGTAVAVATADGRVTVVAPEDEADLASEGGADVYTFRPASLDELRTAAEAVRPKLAEVGKALGLAGKRVGHD